MLVLRLSLLLFFWRVDTHEKDTLQAEMVIKQQEELEIKKKKKICNSTRQPGEPQEPFFIFNA